MKETEDIQSMGDYQTENDIYHANFERNYAKAVKFNIKRSEIKNQTNPLIHDMDTGTVTYNKSSETSTDGEEKRIGNRDLYRCKNT